MRTTAGVTRRELEGWVQELRDARSLAAHFLRRSSESSRPEAGEIAEIVTAATQSLDGITQVMQELEIEGYGMDEVVFPSPDAAELRRSVEPIRSQIALLRAFV